MYITGTYFFTGNEILPPSVSIMPYKTKLIVLTILGSSWSKIPSTLTLIVDTKCIDVTLFRKGYSMSLAQGNLGHKLIL